MRSKVSRFESAESQERHDAAYQRGLALLPPGFEPLDVDTSYGTVRTYRGGPEDRRLLILLGGQDSPAFIWFKALPALMLAHRVVIIEALGEAGASRQTESIDDLSQSVDWLNQAITAVRTPENARFVLAAAGSSAPIAVRYALGAAQDVARLVLLTPWGFGADQPKMPGRRLRAALLGGLPASLRSRIAAQSDLDRLAVPELADYARAVLPFRRALPAIECMDLGILSRLGMPALVLVAELGHSEPEPSWLAELSSRTAGIQLENVPVRNEFLALSRPDLLSAAVMRR